LFLQEQIKDIIIILCLKILAALSAPVVLQPLCEAGLLDHSADPKPLVVISRAFFLFFPCNHIINIKKNSFSGEAKDSVNFSFFILLHKRAKPIHPPYIHPSAHLSTHTSTPSLVRRRRRRILLPYDSQLFQETFLGKNKKKALLITTTVTTASLSPRASVLATISLTVVAL
jgi:hypothetical protein